MDGVGADEVGLPVRRRAEARDLPHGEAEDHRQQRVVLRQALHQRRGRVAPAQRGHRAQREDAAHLLPARALLSDGLDLLLQGLQEVGTALRLLLEPGRVRVRGVQTQRAEGCGHVRQAAVAGHLQQRLHRGTRDAIAVQLQVEALHLRQGGGEALGEEHPLGRLRADGERRVQLHDVARDVLDLRLSPGAHQGAEAQVGDGDAEGALDGRVDLQGLVIVGLAHPPVALGDRHQVRGLRRRRLSRFARLVGVQVVGRLLLRLRGRSNGRLLRRGLGLGRRGRGQLQRGEDCEEGGHGALLARFGQAAQSNTSLGAQGHASSVRRARAPRTLSRRRPGASARSGAA